MLKLASFIGDGLSELDVTEDAHTLTTGALPPRASPNSWVPPPSSNLKVYLHRNTYLAGQHYLTIVLGVQARARSPSAEHVEFIQFTKGVTRPTLL